MLADRLFLSHLGCAVTRVNPSCRFTKSAKEICLGFQDTLHPDLHSSSDQDFCHSEVPDKWLVTACSLSVWCVFSERAGSGMCLTLEACAAHLHIEGSSASPTRCAPDFIKHLRAHTHPLSHLQCLGTTQTTRTMYINSLWHTAKTWPPCPCHWAEQYILPAHPTPLLFL